MSRRRSGLGKGLDVLIPRMNEIEREFAHVKENRTQVFFSDEPEEVPEPAVSASEAGTAGIFETGASTEFESITEARPDNQPEKKSPEDFTREANIAGEAKIAGEAEAKASEAEIKETRAKASEAEEAEDNVSEVKIKAAEEKAEETEAGEQEKTKETENSEKSEYSENNTDPVFSTEPETTVTAADGRVQTVRISQVEPNRNQPRKHFDEEGLKELSDSIRQYGILQPILVQDRGDHYEIIAGERRWRAALKAGLLEVPVVIRREDERRILEMSLIENIQRENLNPVEEAEAYRELTREYGLTQEEVAARVSKSRSAVTNTLRLLKLDERVRELLKDGSLSMGHARALLSLEDKDRQIAAAEEISKDHLSVRDAEKLVKKILKAESEARKDPGGTQEGAAGALGSNPGAYMPGEDGQREEESLRLIYRDIEEKLCQKLGTKVSIKTKGRNQGKLQIDFYSFEDLEKVIEKLS